MKAIKGIFDHAAGDVFRVATVSLSLVEEVAVCCLLIYFLCRKYRKANWLHNTCHVENNEACNC